MVAKVLAGPHELCELTQVNQPLCTLVSVPAS